jgi:4-amino-4-deoxy-L-arabinose transferase-like glycosyltransferase
MRLPGSFALILVALCLYLPFSGSYGLWDPWESNYAEVAREMLASGDLVSLSDHRSNDSPSHFWSKPPLLFWTIAAGMKLAGVQAEGGAADELVRSWRSEWAARLPGVAFALAALWAVWLLLDDLVGRRAAWLGALILACSSQWLLVGRQVMTDMPFVALMTIGLAFTARALLQPSQRVDALVPRRRLGPFSWPAVPAFYVVVSLLLFTVLSQLIVLTAQLKGALHFGEQELSGRELLSPAFVGLALSLVWAARARTLRRLYLFIAYICWGLATLAKGPAGLALPVLAVLAFVAVTGRWRRLGRLEPWRGLVLLTIAAAPWFVAMLVRHGHAFFDEFIGEHYVQRAAGRHGDRGTFEYYALWLVAGAFPWSGVALSSVLHGVRARGSDGERAPLSEFAMVWLIVQVTLLSVVTTKFHHYVLPVLPALAILGAIHLDALLDGDGLTRRLMLIVGVPVTLLTGIVLAARPARLLWLFNYDYVRRAEGLPWPNAADGRYNGAPALLAGTVALALALLALAVAPRWRRALPVAAIAVVPVLWVVYLADHLIPQLSPHWSQKGVIAQYYAKRASPDEPLISFALDWHGENFYTKNAIMAPWSAAERTVFLGQTASDDLKEYLSRHAGRRMFFLFERQRLAALLDVLPDAARASFRLDDESNNKLYLASAWIARPVAAAPASGAP